MDGCAIQTADLHGTDARGDPLHSIANAGSENGKDGYMTTSARYDTIRPIRLDRSYSAMLFLRKWNGRYLHGWGGINRAVPYRMCIQRKHCNAV